MSKQFLTLQGASSIIAAITPEATSTKQIALATTKAFTGEITSEDMAERAARAAGVAKGIASEVEKQRLELARPVNAELTKLKSDSDLFQLDLLNEVRRIDRLLTAWEDAKRKKADDARREKERLETEAREAQAKLQEAERQRAAAHTKSAIAKADESVADLSEEAFEKAVAASEAASIPLPIVKAGTKGANVSRKYTFEVYDIDELYAAHPACVEMTVKKNQVNALIAVAAMNIKPGETILIPGITIKEETAVGIRSVSTAKLQKTLEG